ncbi:Threonine/homoserine efflux transporter RhtA [Rosenbergiella nectarea]|uniref:Threonine/homoserine efflux transporter RhtA n=1 Tax=Rosenbergiella nectarea TaxID=988801 RepID=A0A1H9HGJ5_9GAMM|nr:Threonine/homoserine efflux transporter RhtA [Rosenbergiella nectarea]
MKSPVALKVSRQEATLILITLLWGATFLIVHHAMQTASPFFFVGVRFAVAALLLAAVFWRSLAGVTTKDLQAGTLIGLCIAIGYSFQTWGMQTISSSQSAFMTAMYVPLVPLLQWVFLKRPPGLMSWCGIILAFVGLLLLSGNAGESTQGLGIGEYVTLISTLAIAGEIILISGYAGQVDTKRVTIIQLAAASLFSFLFMVPAGETVGHFPPTVILSAAGLGLMSAIIQLTMNWAQQSISPTRATVIYAGEPVWAGIVGRIAGEVLPSLALLGGVLIVAGVLVSELKIKRRAKQP